MSRSEEIWALPPEDFFRYIPTIGYGCQDRDGGLHFPEDADFSVQNYVFSSCEEVIANNSAWCWEIAELTKRYCEKNRIPYHAYFMEYRSPALHQTHTQVFILYRGMWCPTPDNCLGIKLGELGAEELDSSVQRFLNLFTDYLKAVLKDRYDPGDLLLKEYHCDIPAGIGDEEYLAMVRQG